MSLVQRIDAFTTGAATLTVNIAPPVENNLLIGTFFTRGDSVTNPSGFTTAIEVVNATEDDRIRIVYKVAGPSEADPQWTGLNAADATLAAIYEFSGMDIANPLDKTSSTGRTVGVQTISSGTTAALNQPDEVCVAVAGIRLNVTGTSWDNSYTEGTDLSDGINEGYLMDAYRIVSALDAQQTNASWTGSATVIAAIATFRVQSLAAVRIPFRGSFGRRRTRYAI